MFTAERSGLNVNRRRTVEERPEVAAEDSAVSPCLVRISMPEYMATLATLNANQRMAQSSTSASGPIVYEVGEEEEESASLAAGHYRSLDESG